MFSGFKSHDSKPTPLPAQFFSELLPQIDHLGELKVTLYIIWRLGQMEGLVRFVRRSEIAADTVFLTGLGETKRERLEALSDALERASGRGTVLPADISASGSPDQIFFLNSPKGRAALDGLKAGKWSPEDRPVLQHSIEQKRPNIFRLYETHIGPLTPMLAESLRDAEEIYKPEWIEDAIRIAVENNVRKWRYVEAILKSWQEQGRHDQKDRRDPEADRRKYTSGPFSEFIER